MAQKKANRSATSPRSGKTTGAKTNPSRKSSEAASPSAKTKPEGGASRSTQRRADGATKKSTKPRKSTAGAIAAKTEEILGEMLAGAAVGAVTGAAERVRDEPTAMQSGGAAMPATKGKKGQAGRKGTTSKSARAVAEEMLTGAAVGAVTGAAKAVVSESTGKPKKTSDRKK